MLKQKGWFGMKKYILPFFLLFAMLFSLPASALQGRLTAASVSGRVGEQVELQVHLDNPGIIDTRIFVSYDKKILRLDSAENGDIFADNLCVFGKDLSANPYILLWDDSLNSANNTKSGVLFSLKFTVLSGTAGGQTAVTIRVDDASTFDTNLNSVSIAGCSVAVQVPQAAATQAVSRPTATASPSAPAETTQKTAAAPTPSTEKAVTTTRLHAFDATAKPATATAAAAAQLPASASIPAEQTVPKDAPAAGTAESAAADTAAPAAAPQEETCITETAAADTETAAEPAQTVPAGDTLSEDTAPSRLRFLWLLVIPAAAAALLLLKKKKS